MEKKVINQKEYLKKYLSSGDVDEKKKKKKKKSKFGSQKVKIIDDDIDLKNLRPIKENEFDIFINSEDAPQIVGVVDDRGPVDFTDKKKWRIMADDLDGELQITRNKSTKWSEENAKLTRDVSDGELSSPRLSKMIKEKDIANSDVNLLRKITAKVHKNEPVVNSDSDTNSESNREVHKKQKAKRRRRLQCEDDSDIDDSSRYETRNQDTHSLQSKKNYHTDSDLSPPRRKSIRSQSNSDSDVSLPRAMGHRQQKTHRGDHSPSRKNNLSRHTDSLNDHLPKTKSQKYRKNNNLDSNSPRRHDRKRKKDSDLNHSPTRRKDRMSKSDNHLDLSYPKKKSHQYQKDSDSDLSPPRRNDRKQKYSEIDSDSQEESKILKDSHKKRKERHELWSDQDKSNNRNDFGSVKQSKYADFDHNSGRKHKRYCDDSPPRRERETVHAKYKHAHNNDSEKSLSGRRKHDRDRKYQTETRGRKHSEKAEQNASSGSDLSPARRRCRDTDRNASPPVVSEDNHTVNTVREKERRKHDDGGVARHRTDRNRSEKSSKRRNSVDRANSLEYSERKMKKTLDGKTAGLQDAKALREETEAHKRREADHFNKLSKEISGKGKAAIVRDTKTGRKRDLEAEAAEEREKQKRQQELNEKYVKWGRGLKQVEDHAERLKDDIYEMSKPLARYVDDVDLDRKLREQEREGDPMLDYIKQKQVKEGKRKPDRPEYQGSFMPNRFGIKPGHRWDGVDRSNGYEKKWFEARNARVALQEDAYKWSTADM